MIYSENQLINLAKTNTKELIKILSNPSTNIRTLVDGIEILGLEATEESVVLPAFLLLLKHQHASVREAACVGILTFYERRILPEELSDRLAKMSVSDPSENIRNYIKTIL